MRDSNLDARGHLNALRADGFEITERLPRFFANGTPGTSRGVRRVTLPPALADALRIREAGDLDKQAMVDTCTGETIKPYRFRARYEAARAEVEARNATCPDVETRDWLAYLNALPAQQFAWTPEMKEAAVTYMTTLEAEEYRYREQRGSAAYSYLAKQRHQSAQDAYTYSASALRHLLVMPRPLYSWSPNTPRIYPAGYSVIGLPRDLRRIFQHDAIELDLSSCQLAAFAMLFDIDSLRAVLTDGSIWAELGAILDIDLSGREDVKTVLKSHLIYAACFGMPRNRLLLARYGVGGYPLDGPAVRNLLTSLRPYRMDIVRAPWMHDLLEARDEALARIVRDGVGVGITGRRWTCTRGDEDGARGVLAAVVQDVEWVLLQPVRALTLTDGQGKHGWTCVAYQHDGVSIRPRIIAEGEAVCRKLTTAVDRHAQALGVPTRLEIKWPGYPAPRWG